MMGVCVGENEGRSGKDTYGLPPGCVLGHPRCLAVCALASDWLQKYTQKKNGRLSVGFSNGGGVIN